jgi:hypothetical protein
MHKNIILIIIRMIVAISTLRCFRNLLFPINYDLVNCYGFSNYHGYVPLVISTSRSFPHSWIVTGFVARVTRRMVVEQKLPTRSEHLRSLPVSSEVHVARSLFFCVVFCGSLFVLFLLAIVLSVLLRFTDSDYPFWYLQTRFTLFVLSCQIQYMFHGRTSIHHS